MQRRGRGAYAKLEGMLELENFMAAFAEWQIQAVPMLELKLLRFGGGFHASLFV